MMSASPNAAIPNFVASTWLSILLAKIFRLWFTSDAELGKGKLRSIIPIV